MVVPLVLVSGESEGMLHLGFWERHWETSHWGFNIWNAFTLGKTH